MKKSIVIPILLLIYLGFMSYVGYSGYASGEYSAFYYFGVIAATLCVIVILHFNLKRRERLRRERERDLKEH